MPNEKMNQQKNPKIYVYIIYEQKTSKTMNFHF